LTIIFERFISLLRRADIRMSVREHISRTGCSNFTKLSTHVACGRGFVLLWRHCDTSMLYTSGFVDDAMFSHNSQA